MFEKAKEALQIEADSILELLPRIDDHFGEALKMILHCRGRIIVTGMGKSGIIGRKIAATLASTGTPAFFLHPAEGIHGDLGMVTEHDVVLALSNSGETGEVLNILPSIRRIGARIIAMVGNPESTLAKNADIVLNVGVKREACPLGLAPTSSTTAALAFGDALAMELLSARHFTPEEFAIFHPGGSLGRKLLLTVDDVMHKGDENPVVHADISVKDALFIITDKGVGAVSQMMTKNPKTIQDHKLAAEALHLMESNKPRPITVLPVVDKDRKVVGLLHITDLVHQGVV